MRLALPYLDFIHNPQQWNNTALAVLPPLGIPLVNYNGGVSRGVIIWLGQLAYEPSSIRE